MFSLDTDAGFPDVVLINAAWALGETVKQSGNIVNMIPSVRSPREADPVIDALAENRFDLIFLNPDSVLDILEVWS